MSDSTIFDLKDYNLAMDGPSGSGKTSCGQKMAEILGLKFLDTGIFYRLCAFFLEEKKINWENLFKINQKLLNEFSVEFKNKNFYLNKQIVDFKKLYKFDIEKKARLVSLVPQIRKKITTLCQTIIKQKNFLLIGRDTTSVIAPEAEIKIYLDVSLTEQAKRKQKLFQQEKKQIKIKDWEAILNQANLSESKRKQGPLVRVKDAIYFRNENMTIEETTNKLVRLVRQELQLFSKIAIVGESNVGKSTLFNRLAQRRLTITSSLPHTTRDQFSTLINWEGEKFVLIDTGGFDNQTKTTWQTEIDQRTEILIKKCDVVLWVNNVNEGISPLTEKIGTLLKKVKQKTILVLNKNDLANSKKTEANWEKFGIRTMTTLSAKSGQGLLELKKIIRDYLPTKKILTKKEPETKRQSLVIMGQVNSGKSSLFNLLVRQEKSIVSATVHTTTNIVLSPTILRNIPTILVDTAGIRKKNNKKTEIEKKSLQQTLKYLKRAALVLLVVDLNAGPTVQDKKIVRLAQDEKIPFIIVANKQDLLTEDFPQRKIIFEKFWFYLKKQKNIVYISVKKEEGIRKLTNEILKKFSNLI